MYIYIHVKQNVNYYNHYSFAKNINYELVHIRKQLIIRQKHIY